MFLSVNINPILTGFILIVNSIDFNVDICASFLSTVLTL